ncbi:MAG: 16S rRNA (cytosine(1402)-N(4))-methyltransferase RsmH [Gammaproteobacteria bacterium]|nr:16S rRNA (cytosine(1402)-N(4))-methyltransferase RsmH [Gammaproteobacteria bacterium]
MLLHTAVLGKEAVAALNIKPKGFYIDATFGRGGHASLVLAQLDVAGRLLVLDRDPAAMAEARQLSQEDKRVKAEHANFSQLGSLVSGQGKAGKVDGVLFDLGVSSPQLDDPVRGFSFMRDGPLDMRMDNGNDTNLRAAEWVNSATEAELADVLRRFGEEKFYRRIAAAIVKARQESPVTSTSRLADIVKAAHPAWEQDRHPATRTFQAIRIYINREFEELEQALAQTMEILAPGGRLVAISFHSGEDRIVKRFIDNQARGDHFPRKLPITADQLVPVLKKKGKAIRPSRSEIIANPRARSAVMRIAEKLA